MDENIKVDGEELYKQMREDLIKDGYAKVEILVGKVPKQPMCDVSIHGVTYKEIGLLYSSLDEIKKTIIEKFPLAILWAQECLEMGEKTQIDIGEENNE